jgi:hypothetical protein
MIILSILVAAIMAIVSVLHFYWAFGGSYGLRSAGPTLEDREPFIPGVFLIFSVACILLGLAILSIQLVWPLKAVQNLVPYMGYFVSAVLMIRGVGDFKYVGMFKKIYNSNFARLDTKYFSPLILLLSLAYAILSKYGL